MSKELTDVSDRCGSCKFFMYRVINDTLKKWGGQCTKPNRKTYHDRSQKACKLYEPYNELEELDIKVDEYIKVPKKALKYRTAGMVAYNAEWLKNHFDIERAVICGTQQSCDDAISRQAVTDTTICDGISCNECSFNTCEDGQFGCLLKERVDKLPSVNPQEPEPETGHWEWLTEDKYRCSNCNSETRVDECLNEPMYEFCPFCGARMESEDEE